MVTINLLPWRQYTRAYHVKVMKRMIIMMLSLAIFIIVGVHRIIAQQIQVMQKRVTRLEQSTHRLVNLNKLSHLKQDRSNTAKLEKIISSYRAATQNLFAEFTKVYKPKVCFTEITRTKNTLIFSGNTRSAADLTEFLKTWSAAYLFEEIKLEQMQQKNGFIYFHFQALESQTFPSVLRRGGS